MQSGILWAAAPAASRAILWGSEGRFGTIHEPNARGERINDQAQSGTFAVARHASAPGGDPGSGDPASGGPNPSSSPAGSDPAENPGEM